jgi:hypothetical protein
VQTFLPYPSFAESAAALDPLRLGKQRVETLQIIRALTRPTYGWKHHPAVLMWKGYEEALGSYGLAVVEAWCALGRADTCEGTMVADLAEAGIRRPRPQAKLPKTFVPPWLGDPALHRSHQSALVRKDPAFYRPQFPDVPDDLDYVWPVRKAA